MIRTRATRCDRDHTAISAGQKIGRYAPIISPVKLSAWARSRIGRRTAFRQFDGMFHNGIDRIIAGHVLLVH
jgi:hypothetical protein